MIFWSQSFNRASRCNPAKNAALAASEDGSEREALFALCTLTGFDQAVSSPASATTRVSVSFSESRFVFGFVFILAFKGNTVCHEFIAAEVIFKIRRSESAPIHHEFNEFLSPSVTGILR
jgi:hypothetical protein